MTTFHPSRMHPAVSAWGLCALLQMPVLAQPIATPGTDYNVVQLSASAQREVVYDWLSVALVARAQGSEAAQVQRQLSQVLQTALGSLRGQTRPGEVEVETGVFHVTPRYGKEGQITGWQGSAQLLLQGRDAARITDWSGRLPGLSVGGVNWSLSTASTQRYEADVRQQAIEAFRQNAQQIAQGFGYKGYRLREVSVATDAGNGPVRPRPLAVAMDARMAAPEVAVPTEPGKGLVRVVLSGAVQLQ